MTRKIILLLFILTAFAMSACDPDDMESCDKTLTESEVNNSISSANDFSIMLKNGCKVEIKGYVDGVDTDDFFKVNTGDANNVFITVKWDTGTDAIDLYVVDFDNWVLDSGAISDINGDLAANRTKIEYWGYEFETFFINIFNWSGTPARYTITIQGTRN